MTARCFAGPLLLTAALGLNACFGDPKGPTGDPDRMSDSEYDIARDLWLRQGKTRDALSHALEAVKLNDENADAQHLVALLYLDFCSHGSGPSGNVDCRLDEAEAHARAALAARKDYREARNTLGVVLIHRKRYPDAIGVLKPLTTDILYPTPENAWGNLGWAYLEKGDLVLAIDALRRSVAAQPMFCVGNYRLGLAHERKGQPSQALESLTQALETAGCERIQEAYAARGRVQMKLGHMAEAEADLDHCVSLSKASAAGRECAALLGKLK